MMEGRHGIVEVCYEFGAVLTGLQTYRVRAAAVADARDDPIVTQ